MGLVEDKLAEYGQATDLALRDQLPTGRADRWLYDLVRDYPSRPGKMIRPTLCIATCKAFGGSLEEALPSAVAIELFHNAFLVHDDIMDESRQRRGASTLHRSAGLSLALNAGNALAVLGYRALRSNVATLDSTMSLRVYDEFDDMALRTLEGQATELGWRRDNITDLSVADYLELVGLKTCWYTTILPLRVGALVGSWGEAELDPLSKLGFHMGAAFQIQDDVLNLVGDEQLYGKESSGDLYEGKRTLVLIHLMEATRGRDRQQLERFLASSRDQRTAEDVAMIHRLIRVHDALGTAKRLGEGVAADAETLFDAAFAGAIDGEDKEFVRQLIPYLLRREL